MDKETRLFYVLLPITVVALGHALYLGSGLFLWVICSYFLFLLIEPSMKKLTDRRVTPAVSALLLVLLSSTVLFAMGFLIFRSSSGIISQLMNYRSTIRQFYHSSTSHLHEWTTVTQTVHSTSTATTGAVGANTAEAIPPALTTTGILTGVSAFLGVLSYVALTPLLTFFMIAERETFATVFRKLMKSDEKAREITFKIKDAVTAYFVGNLSLILFSFPVFLISFWYLGVKAFVILSALSALFNLIPFLGFFLAAMLPTLDLLMNGGHPAQALLLIAVCFLTHFTIANIVTPKLLGSKVDLNATTSTIALIGWGGLWGPIGLLIAIPVTAILKIFFQYSQLEFFQCLAALMSENPESLHLQGFSFIKKMRRSKKA